MGKNSRPSHKKREKEKTRQERQKEKTARRVEAKERKASAPPRSAQDPDIAGIVPGPQALPSEFDTPVIRRQP